MHANRPPQTHAGSSADNDPGRPAAPALHPATEARSTQGLSALNALSKLDQLNGPLRIGVDGGGTGTRVRLEAADGRLIGVGRAGPSALGQGVEAAWRQIQAAIADAAAQAGMAPPEPAHCLLGLGLSGADVPSQAQAFVAADPGCAGIVLESDGYTSVLGAHAGQPGAVVAAGTGSVGEVLRRNGTRHRVGGWGWHCGDEGSGAWLGLRAMQHAHQALDGRARAGGLAHAVWALAGSTRDDLLNWCAQAGQNAYASLAPTVFDAEADDAAAADLILKVIDDLARIARALDPAGELPLVITGSIGARVAARLPADLAPRCAPPAGDAAEGALRLLLNRAAP